MNRRRISVVGFCVGIVLFVHCTTDIPIDPSAGKPVIADSTLPFLPSCIADKQPSIPPPDRVHNDKVVNAYDLFRFDAYSANQLINGKTRSLRLFFQEDCKTIPWDIVRARGEYQRYFEKLMVAAYHKPADTLPFSIKIENSDSSRAWKGQALFNGDLQYPRGVAYIFIARPEDPDADSVVVKVVFEKRERYHSCIVDITRRLLGDNNDKASKFHFRTVRMDTILYISGSSYHPNFESLQPAIKGVCYNSRAVVDLKHNRSVVTFGLSPALVDDTAGLFTEYGMEKTFGSVIIKNCTAMDTATMKWIVTSYKEAITLPTIEYKLAHDPSFVLHGADEIDSMTYNDLERFLTLNHPLADTWKKRFFFLRLTQPVYCYEKGYFSNGNAPAGFEILNALPFMTTCIKPHDVEQLHITAPLQK